MDRVGAILYFRNHIEQLREILANNCDDDGYFSDIVMPAIEAEEIALDALKEKKGAYNIAVSASNCEFKCSVCGTWVSTRSGEMDGGAFMYCPNCGEPIC